VAISFIGGGNWKTRRKPPTFQKSLTNFIYNVVQLALIEIRTQNISGDRLLSRNYILCLHFVFIFSAATNWWQYPFPQNVLLLSAYQEKIQKENLIDSYAENNRRRPCKDPVIGNFIQIINSLFNFNFLFTL